jgi:hypothetical protein
MKADKSEPTPSGLKPRSSDHRQRKGPRISMGRSRHQTLYVIYLTSENESGPSRDDNAKKETLHADAGGTSPAPVGSTPVGDATAKIAQVSQAKSAASSGPVNFGGDVESDQARSLGVFGGWTFVFAMNAWSDHARLRSERAVLVSNHSIRDAGLTR